MRERDKYSQKINFKYKIFFKKSSTYKITVTPGGGGTNFKENRRIFNKYSKNLDLVKIFEL
jgi:hypothetical protein